MPTICTLAKIWSCPNRSLSADGPPRTLSWEVVCPSTGATGAVGVGGAGVAEGRGVGVGGRVEVITTSGVGVGVPGADSPALQAVNSKARTTRVVTM